MSDIKDLSDSKVFLKLNLQNEILEYPLNTYKSSFISQFHRKTSIKWIFETINTLNSTLKSSYLACTYFDIFLSKISIPNIEILELIALTCISITLKFNEGKALSTEEKSLILESKYSKDTIIQTELYILNTLDWRLHKFTVTDSINEIIPIDFTNREKVFQTASTIAVFLITDERGCKSGITAISLASISVALNLFKASCQALAEYEGLVDVDLLRQLKKRLNKKINNKRTRTKNNK